MTKEEIEEYTKKYIEQDNFEKAYRDDLNEQIKELKRLIHNSFDKNIYSVIYKGGMQDYREFVEAVAKELRKINKERKLE